MAQWEAATVAAVGAAAISDPPGMTLTGFSNVEKITSAILPLGKQYLIYSPAFSALFELILSHNARIAPSNNLKNSSKMQVQNCGTYSFNITLRNRYGRNANLRNARSCSSPQTRNNNGAFFREDIHKFPHESAWG